MAQFRATIKGQRGEASRLGSKRSGIVAVVNGWEAGVRVEARVDAEGRDVFDVYSTAGSNHSGCDVWIATVRQADGFPVTEIK